MKIKKIMGMIIVLLLFLGAGYFLLRRPYQEYSLNLFYMDTYIQIKFDTKKSRDDVKKIKEEVTKIYQDYHELANRYTEYGQNVYYLIHNTSEEEVITVDPKLYELLSYGEMAYRESNGLLDINMGCVIDKWKYYRERKEGIPTDEELESCNSVNRLVLLGENQVLNNHPNIDLGAIAKGYATEKVKEYFESVGITSYIINAGGNVVVGTPQNKDYYQVGIEDPNDGSVFKVLKVTNQAVVTSGGYERFYEYEGHKYHHIIDPNTNYPSEYMKSVTIITDDSALADQLSTTLFLMSIEEGKAYIERYPNVEVIWYSNDDEIIMTEGVKKYE